MTGHLCTCVAIASLCLATWTTLYSIATLPGTQAYNLPNASI